MRICSNEPCIVLLTEKDTWLRVNGKEPISLKANYMAILACENNVIDISSLNSVLVIQVSRNNIKDYLQFLNKDLTPSRLATQRRSLIDRQLSDAGYLQGRCPLQRDGSTG